MKSTLIVICLLSINSVVFGFTVLPENSLRDTSNFTKNHFELMTDGGEEAVAAFEKALQQSIGDKLISISNVSFNDGNIRKLQINYKSPTGLKMKLRLAGLQKLIFNWKIDENGQLYNLDYQFNECLPRHVDNDCLSGDGSISISHTDEDF